MLEECALDYNVHVVDITRGEQFETEFRKINPNRRIPAIFDQDGADGKSVRVFESGAILIYLAEKTGRFLGVDPATRLDALQWLMLQVGGVGPMFGQAFHYLHQAPEDAPSEAIAYGRDRYKAEVERLCGVLDYRLREFEYLAKTYTIADMATFPWVALHQWLGVDLENYVGLNRWYETLKRRPTVRRGMDVPPKDSL